MGLREIEATLPPGFRFYPSDEELLCHYLYEKIANGQVSKDTTLVEIDLHTCEPWQLPEVAKLNSKEWYFFSFRDRKYSTGYRTNRATTSGYWKATGKDRPVLDPRTRCIIGMRKTLVFYRNRAPNGTKTDWIMHEFRLENPHVPPKEDWVLCRVFQKAKAENSENDVSDTTAGGGSGGGSSGSGGSDISPTLAASPPIGHRMTQGYNQICCFSQTPSSHQIQNNFLQLPQQKNQNPVLTNQMVHSKCEDEYELLFNMDFGDANLGDGGSPFKFKS